MTEKKILILEDNKIDAELLLRELKRSGLSFSSEVVQTREEFEYMLDHMKPDIIISDYSLPQFDGVTAFKIKQKIYPAIPFIIVSGTIGEENAVELIKNGVTDYNLKDKLNFLNQKVIRALKEAEEKKEKIIAVEKIKTQNSKLMEIVFLQSHQVRAPIVNIFGLINMFNLDNPSDPVNSEVIKNLQKTVTNFDNIIREIVQKTKEIIDMQ
jgi:DNA-binding NtrC family response regulator